MTKGGGLGEGQVVLSDPIPVLPRLAKLYFVLMSHPVAYLLQFFKKNNGFVNINT